MRGTSISHATRAAATQETRRRIIEAAKALHAGQGILATNYAAIAQQAGTAQATVYRHFPSLADLLPACARSITVLQTLTPEQAAATFAGLSHPELRVEVPVRGTCECYERDAGWLRAAHREADLLPASAVIVDRGRASLRLMVQSALAGTAANECLVQVVAALLDYPVWKSLREADLRGDEAAAELLDLIRIRLIHAGIL